jgi:hypothetical protein
MYSPWNLPQWTGIRLCMSPERMLPPFFPSMASDVWSLALLFLEVTSGHPTRKFFSANGKISAAIIKQLCPCEFVNALMEDTNNRCGDLEQLKMALAGNTLRAKTI